VPELLRSYQQATVELSGGAVAGELHADLQGIAALAAQHKKFALFTRLHVYHQS
jgi:hypothetical protein